ncbi:hypothetical protein ABZ729_34295 [Streptomyces sp. NPDC006678]
MTVEQVITKLAADGTAMDQAEIERHLNHLRHGFELEATERSSGN